MMEQRLRRPATVAGYFPAHRLLIGRRHPLVPPGRPGSLQTAHQLAFRVPVPGTFPAADNDIEGAILRSQSRDS